MLNLDAFKRQDIHCLEYIITFYKVSYLPFGWSSSYHTFKLSNVVRPTVLSSLSDGLLKGKKSKSKWRRNTTTVISGV